MFREKYNPFKDKRGYLYLRESIYKRDKRTYKRKPSKLGDGKATKERGKYTKKKDTYLGKIIEKELQKVISFQEFLVSTKKIKSNEEFLKYKININFENLLMDFIKYLLTIYEINSEEFFNKEKKKVYQINNGFLSPLTIDWLKRFRIRPNYSRLKELERFQYRCEDIGIFDKDIIGLLFSKLEEDQGLVESEEETQINKEEKLKDFKLKKLKDFIKKSVE